MKILAIYGTRPEYLKIKPVIIKSKGSIKTCLIKQHTNIIDFGKSDFSIEIENTCTNRLNNIFSETTLLFPFSKFNDLLRFSGVVGEKVQLKVSDKLLSNEELPYIIDLINENIVFTNCTLEIVPLHEENS